MSRKHSESMHGSPGMSSAQQLGGGDGRWSPLRFAGGMSWEKTRRLPQESAHYDDLRTVACQLMDAASLQRGRLTSLVLRGEDLVDADQVTQQISLDTAREDRLVAEAAMDRVRAKYGPAALFCRAS
ncbi:hypothetical protein [Streptomyces sp. NPDC001978]|uniref:hypothetical protein n=1 Tax=Streptomyces sp. NPDC001978 TaxID=3364627 RepID=UPI0036861A5C